MGQQQLLIATSNPGKVAEFRDLLSGCRVAIVTPAHVGLKLDVAESGGTYRENARLKAVAYAGAARMLSLADDSGLEVDALDGAPGLHSARYAGLKAADADRFRLLLKNLAGVPAEQRTARFRCVIAIAVPGSVGGPAAPVPEVTFFEGACEGIITFEPRGTAGFGYDPVFLFPELGMTMAELPEGVKNRVSHRGRAAALACEFLRRLSGTGE